MNDRHRCLQRRSLGPPDGTFMADRRRNATRIHGPLTGASPTLAPPASPFTLGRQHAFSVGCADIFWHAPRTAGGCGNEQVSYNSRRNRHCPQCQGSAAQRWLEDRQADLLPVPYFHVVYVVRHTWRSALTHHPHVHGIVLGGGISSDGSRWVACQLAPRTSVRIATSNGSEASGNAPSRCVFDRPRSSKHLQELSRDHFVALQRQLACAPRVSQGLLAKDDAS
jgi:hypothetical protein